MVSHYLTRSLFLFPLGFKPLPSVLLFSGQHWVANTTAGPMEMMGPFEAGGPAHSGGQPSSFFALACQSSQKAGSYSVLIGSMCFNGLSPILPAPGTLPADGASLCVTGFGVPRECSCHSTR